jgi:diacylglycerol kinase (ATP)
MQAREATGQSPDLGVVPSGTGDDFARGLGLVADIERLAARIAAGERRTIDAGRVSFVNDDGALASRCFINIASLGLSGPTDRAVNAAKSNRKVLGKLVFLFHTVRELIRYRFQEVRVTVDGGEPIEARIALLAVANAPYFGGGMKIAPDAVPDDALFQVVIIRGRSKLSLISDLRLVYSGAHRGLTSCTFLSGRKIVVEPLGDLAANAALLDIDGESPGRIPATFEIIPGALTVRG